MTTTMAVVMERVASRAECQLSTELVYLVVAAPLAEPRRNHDLVRPAASIPAADSSPLRRMHEPLLECSRVCR